MIIIIEGHQFQIDTTELYPVYAYASLFLSVFHRKDSHLIMKTIPNNVFLVENSQLILVKSNTVVPNMVIAVELMRNVIFKLNEIIRNQKIPDVQRMNTQQELYPHTEFMLVSRNIGGIFKHFMQIHPYAELAGPGFLVVEFHISNNDIDRLVNINQNEVGIQFVGESIGFSVRKMHPENYVAKLLTLVSTNEVVYYTGNHDVINKFFAALTRLSRRKIDFFHCKFFVFVQQ